MVSKHEETDRSWETGNKENPGLEGDRTHKSTKPGLFSIFVHDPENEWPNMSFFQFLLQEVSKYGRELLIITEIFIETDCYINFCF